MAIFVTLLLFLRSFQAACIVIFCVASTIIEISGFLYFWGLTIDVVSCNILVISVGLCVDFFTHIAHGFLVSPGDRNARISSALLNIGPAVFNGAMSTLLAFILLSTSESYVFHTFFKIFFLICSLGLYQSLFVLPVILSIYGPLPPEEIVSPLEQKRKQKWHT